MTFHPSQNLLEYKGTVDIQDYLDVYKNKISHESERLFITEFLYPLLGREGIKYVIPQYAFIDSEGKNKKIDFVVVKDNVRLALEIDGESYHADGAISSQQFDDNLQRQNDIINAGWFLQRFSYTQLQSPAWRERVADTLHRLIAKHLPELIGEDYIKPNYLQIMALDALQLWRNKGWNKGIVVLPTGTGKTFLSAFDAKKFNGRTLFIVHRLDILSQSKDAFEKVWHGVKSGTLTGDVKDGLKESKILFASKDTIRNQEYLSFFPPDEFDYVIIDEIHHGQAPSYQSIIKYFKPKFLLGITATPDRTDRKDIFELFDYNKVFEYTLNEAIKNGFLVPFSYYGLKDNIDYTKIRYNGSKYNVQDLDKHLIIDKRNEQILREYISKGGSNKAIGFCCSIKHADRMASFFNERGIPSIAITSEDEKQDREKKIRDFRDGKYFVAFTVDLFNEGIDFPEVRVLLFLRPTESKTIFEQQLGRGLRLRPGKNRAVILDFIADYKKANRIRQYLATNIKEKRNEYTNRIEKKIYEYAPGCDVYFVPEVEEVLNKQDREEMQITKEDLADAYYTLAEQLRRKPTQDDINNKGEFKIARYLNVYGSWTKFLREIGEYTEATYHYPQGVHLGHILYALKVIFEENVNNSHFNDRYVRLRGNFDSDRLGGFQRQTKYKLQAMMEMNLIKDDREFDNNNQFTIELTEQGRELYLTLKPVIDKIDLSFSRPENGVPSWSMKMNPPEFNTAIWNFLKTDESKLGFVRKILLETHAVGQMLNYLYTIERRKVIPKVSIYSGFFKAPFVQMYCQQNGIEIATVEGAKHRCPLLLNLLESVGIISQSNSEVQLGRFLICKATMRLIPNEGENSVAKRIQATKSYLEGGLNEMDTETESLLKEAFGGSFLSDKFYLDGYEFLFE